MILKKIIVIGCPGSGKTTFAQKLSKKIGLPLYHLDAIWHKPDKSHVTREEFAQRVTTIFDLPQWIIDGNYTRTLQMRLDQCDTVFLFDLPTDICLQGATERIGKARCDLPWIEQELDADFKQHIEEFAQAKLPLIYELLDKYKSKVRAVVFKSRESADEYLKNIS